MNKVLNPQERIKQTIANFISLKLFSIGVIWIIEDNPLFAAEHTLAQDAMAATKNLNHKQQQ